MKRLIKVFAETTHGTKGYETINKIKVDTESISNLSEIITTLGKVEDVLEKYGIENAEELDKLIHHKDKKITDLQHRLEVAEKALTKAVNDKCEAENIIVESFVGKGAKAAVPKKEQWYLEQAERELKGE